MQPPSPTPTNTQIRAWARENGFAVSDRGRLPARVVEAYDAAHATRAPDVQEPQPAAPEPVGPDPEPVDPEPSPAPTFEGPAGTPARRRERVRPPWLPAAIAALTAVVLLAAVLFLVLRDGDVGPSTASGDVTFDDVKLGDCTAEIPEGVTLTVSLIPCDEPHEGEVYATFELSGDDYPGAEEVERFALGGCQREAVAALPPDDETLYDLVYLAPSEQTWERGDRTVSCVLSDPSGEPLVGSVLDGSAQR